MHTFKYFTISSEKKQQSLPPAIKWSILICIKFYGEDFYETTKIHQIHSVAHNASLPYCITFCGCSANSGKISKTGFYFDTMITVTLYGTRDEKILMIAFPWQETTKRNFQTPSQTVKFQRLTRQTASL